MSITDFIWLACGVGVGAVGVLVVIHWPRGDDDYYGSPRKPRPPDVTPRK